MFQHYHTLLLEVAKHFRPLYNGTLMINPDLIKKGNKVIEEGYADLVAR
jgi:N-ethylmaleimide reductase